MAANPTPASAPLVTTVETVAERNLKNAESYITKVEGSVTTAESSAKSWLQKHERIILVALVLGAGSWFGDHWLNVTAARDQQQASLQVQQLDVQKAKDNQIAQQVSTLTTQYQAVVTELTQENAKIASQVQTRVTVLHDRQKTDQSLPLPDLGGRWAQLANIAPSDIAASTAGITVTDTGARETVTQLEQVPVLQDNLKDTQTIVANQKDELDKSADLTGALTTQVTSLQKTNVDEETACKAEITSTKATANKSKSKWFKIGFGLGFVTGFILDRKL